MASSPTSLEDCSSSTHAPSTPIDSQFEMVESPRDGPCPSHSASSLPWLWVIQAVATCKEIHISTLKDLIDVAPVAQDDFCKKTRELIALRCLEDLFDSARRVVCDDDAASLYSRVGFDFSSSCEDVLQQILDEIPLLNLKMAGAELLKWDAFPFIMHKRATVKCDLEQLKESISEGTHPYTYYLREISGLAYQNGGYPVHVDDSECSDLSEKDNGNCNCCANMEANENSVSVILGNGNKSSKESLLDKTIPSKRNRVESANEHIMGCQHGKQVDINDCHDFLINAKKIRYNASLDVESKKEKPVSPHGKRVLENSKENFLLVFERGGCHIDKDVKENLGEGSIEGSHDRCIASSNRCISSSHNEVFHSESNIPFNATMMLQHTSGGEYCQEHEGESIPTKVLLPDEIPHETKEDTEHKVPDIVDESQSKRKIDFQPIEPNAADDKAVADTVNGCGAEILSDNDGFHNETIDLAAKKHKSLSSHCTFGHGISTSTRLTENDLCMKCNEVGELLVCMTTTCPIMVHKSCLSTSAQLDAEGNFFCPFCAYCQAFSEYHEAKKKASLARKELAIFICKDLGHQNTQLLLEVNGKEHSLSRKNRTYEHIHNQNNRDDRLSGTVDSKDDNVFEYEINGLHFEKNQQQALTSRANSSCNEKKIVNNGIVEGLSGKGRAEMPNLKYSTSRGVGKKQVPAELLDDDDMFSCEKANVLTINQGNTEEIQREMLEQHITVQIEEPACVPDSEKEENSKDEDESPIISRSARRLRRRETNRKPLASFQSRQKQYRGWLRRKS